MLINHSGMQATSQNLSGASRHIKTALETLETNLNNGPRQRWSGEAEAAFQVAHQNWNAAFADLSALLDQIGVKVFDADSAYRSTDVAQAANFR
ncbi:MAG: WXG100 family type VII secretion target [Propioniciclava sp.]